ncbi:TPA: restriction endonuclease subunit S [Bacillus luti]
MTAPKLRFKEFTDIWKEYKLMDFAESIIGLTYSPDDIVSEDEGTLILRSSNIKDSNLVFTDNVYVKTKIPEKLMVQPYDILLCSRNGSRALIGKSAFIDKHYHNTSFGAFMTIIRSKQNSKFSYQLLKTNNFKKQMHINLGATINQITTKDLNNFKFYMPSSNVERKKIAIFLEIFDKKIQLQQEKIDLLKEQKKGYMQKIFSRELRFKDKDGQEYPKWSQQKLGDFTERVTRKNSDLVTTRPLTISAQHGLIDQIEFFNKTVASENLTGYYLLNKGEFAYNKSYSNGYPLGAIKRLDDYQNGALSTLYICFTPKDNVISDFLVHYFDSAQWYKEVSLICVEGARNHGLLNVSVSEFFDTLHYLPCTEEQIKIAKFFDCINQKIKLQEQTLKNIQAKKQALMQQMFI